MIKTINKKIEQLENSLLKVFKHYFQKHRLRIYITGFLTVILFVISEIPYINLIVVPFKNLLIAYLVIFAIVGPAWRRLLLIGILLFVPLPVLILLGESSLAEHIANIIYLVLVTATIFLFKDTIGSED